ncbi:glycosyltransferase family 2 protein [Halobacillus amylolyticus]|uniref:Glycosyltransferase n=1 Tax=Halobacillus amylolyticus TaxID=2932259 RepID=A0ABY4HGN3_9BACI|nr:glycosyltransferase [Halobacillus amylolyticus]UOR13789.1 glycosyltransferase [Halobacillus amylolyticus]
MNPTISIIVPVYNVEPYLRRCLDSILAQTFTNIEVIVVNDGSTDGSGLICDEFATKDERVKVIHKENGGVSSARNIGIDEARGNFIGFVDSDDWVFEDMFGRLFRICLNSNCDIAVCDFAREINGKGSLLRQESYTKTMNNEEAMRQLFKGKLYRFALCNKLYKKKCFFNVRFPEGRIHEDLSTTYKLFYKADKVVFTNYTGYIYVKRDRSILTSRFSRKRMEAFIGWDEIISFMESEYPRLSKEYLTCFVYWCIDNSFYILNQVNHKKVKYEFLSIIQECVKKYYKNILRTNNLSFKYKYLITVLNYSTRSFCFQYNVNKFIRNASS